MKIKKEKGKEREEGSILTRPGILEAVFEQGEECSARGGISAGEEARTSTAQGVKGLEKQRRGLKCVRYAGRRLEKNVFRRR